MAPPSSPLSPFKHLYGVMLVLCLILTSSAVLAAYTLSMNAAGWKGGRNSILTVPIGQIFGVKSDRKIVLYASPETRAYFTSAGGNYETLLQPWRNFLLQERIPYNEVTQLDPTRAGPSDVLILPSAVALGDATRAQLRAYRDAGGNLLATSAIGARNAEGKWLGYEFSEQLLGIKVLGEIPADKDERYVNLFGDLPLTRAYAAGQRIYLGNASDKPLRLAGGTAAATITNWTRTVSAPQKPAVSIAFDEFGPSKHHARVVMIGFSETTWNIQSYDIHALLFDAISWLEHRPIVYQGTWPSPYRAAHVVEMDTEEGFSNAIHFERMLDKVSMRGTFYMLTSVAKQYPEIVREIAKNHEIAYHADIHTGFKNLPEARQASRLAAMQADMKQIVGDTSRVTGFRAPTESYDRLTEDLLIKRGLRHHTADPNRTDARVPLFYPDKTGMHDSALVVLPRTQLDDINILDMAGNDPRRIERLLIQDFNGIVQTGGLGVVSIHSQNFGLEAPLTEAFSPFLAHLDSHRDQVWMAPAGAVSSWWRERQRLTYKVEQEGPRLRLDVTITGQKPVQPIALFLTKPTAAAELTITPVTTRGPLPKISKVDAYRLSLVFTGMKPGSYSYNLSFEDDIADLAQTQEQTSLKLLEQAALMDDVK